MLAEEGLKSNVVKSTALLSGSLYDNVYNTLPDLAPFVFKLPVVGVAVKVGPSLLVTLTVNAEEFLVPNAFDAVTDPEIEPPPTSVDPEIL